MGMMGPPAPRIRHQVQSPEIDSFGRRGIIKNKDAFDHAVANTFVHEWSLSKVKPDFWTTNSDRFPCQYDHHVFDGPIHSYPVSYKNNEWIVRGVFCSEHCALKYITIMKNMPAGCITLFTLMIRMIYHGSGDTVPASDVELLLNPLQPMTIEEWRAIPKQKVQIRLLSPQFVPFRMEQRQVVSHPARSHEAYNTIKEWNQTMATGDSTLEDESVNVKLNKVTASDKSKTKTSVQIAGDDEEDVEEEDVEEEEEEEEAEEEADEEEEEAHIDELDTGGFHEHAVLKRAKV